VACRRVVLASVIVALVGLAAPSPAGADCVGPAFSHPTGPIDRGDTIRIEGTGWGGSCYDTGPPPPGQGVLGLPLDGIEVVLVQDGRHHVVAIGAADADLAFTVDVPVPAALVPGPVEVLVRAPVDIVAFDGTPDPVVVSDVAPSAGDPGADPVTFGGAEAASPDGPATTTTSSPPPGAADDDDGSLLGPVVVGVVVVALTVAVVVLFARARQGPTGPRPV